MSAKCTCPHAISEAYNESKGVAFSEIIHYSLFTIH